MNSQLTKHRVLWDGECNFCRRATNWAAKRDNLAQFEFVPSQNADIAPELRRACRDAVHVLTPDGQTLRAGRATLFILERLGWGFIAKVLSIPPLIWLVELAYKIVARNRDFFARFMFKEK